MCGRRSKSEETFIKRLKYSRERWKEAADAGRRKARWDGNGKGRRLRRLSEEGNYNPNNPYFWVLKKVYIWFVFSISNGVKNLYDDKLSGL